MITGSNDHADKICVSYLARYVINIVGTRWFNKQIISGIISGTGEKKNVFLHM